MVLRLLFNEETPHVIKMKLTCHGRAGKRENES